MKPYKTPEGATQVEMPSGRHPKSHFETHEVRIVPSENDGFTVHHHKRLKKKFENMGHMHGGYMEPEQHVFPHAAAMHQHLQTIFKGGPEAVQAEMNEGKGGVSEDESETE